jgi:hypothetical protein
MTSVFARGLDGELGAGYDPRCAAACHTLGEAGVADGGFADVARALGVTLPAHPAAGAWAALPRALRRLGGVGCTACHGPGAIPEASARWSILRADVCATCHDAPPRYAVVAGWRAGRMARADAAAGARAEGCRDCHTTAGFLAAAGVRPLGVPAPDDVGPMGVACAACHAPHDVHGRRLLRELPPPAVLGAELPPAAAESGVCLGCHTPRPAGSSSAAIWLGRGGLRVADGAPLVGPAPHAAVPCTGCHDGVGHGFAVTPRACGPCHASGPPPIAADIAARAAALGARLGVGAHGTVTAASDRAAWNVRLVLEDRGAAAHNPVYARKLLDEADAQSAR